MERTDVKNNHTEEYSTGQIRCIEKSDPEYPQIMKQYSSMPAKLYVKGRLPDPKRRTVAVIGARMCSPYGRMQAFRYAKALSVAGVQIISGMALGIDSEGHKGALEGKMPTFAVLGSGVDVCYPKSNRKLYERILWENGGIISECPLGSGPVSWHFPARNRIISALSDAVLVVEAKENSGSLITAGFALEQARTATNEMAEATQTALFTAMDLIWDYKEEAADKVDRLEKNVDEYEDQLDSYLVKLSRKTMTDKESHELSILLHSINDFERMTDHALNVMQHAQELHNKNLTFSAKACDDMNIYGGAVKEIVSMAVTAFTGNDLNLARQIEPLEIVIDGIDMEEKRRHVRRLRKGKCTVEAGFILQDITTDYERIADHCSNIAVEMLQVNEDGFDTHEYLEREKKADTPEFEAEIRKYEDKYALPKLKKDDDIQTNAVDKYVKSDKTSLSPKQGKLKADKIVKADKASKDKTIKDKKSGKDKADKVDKAKKSSDTAQ